jgi:Na+/H+ antiporter NhaA
VLVIALAYTAEAHWTWLSIGCGFFGALVIANRLHISRPSVYALLGIGLWLAGIDFTMSLFIAELCIEDAGPLARAKVGILAASLLSGVAGCDAGTLQHDHLDVGGRAKGRVAQLRFELLPRGVRDRYCAIG